MSTRVMYSGLLALTMALGACADSQGGSTSGPPASGLPTARRISAVPMDHMAGVADSAALARSIASPYQGNPQAIAEGHALYIRMNCAGCHAYTGKGNMGPSLVDNEWRYGGYPVQIYRSIHDGRAQGMPAWGAALPPQEIWKLVAFIQSLGGTYPAGGTPLELETPEQVAPEVQASIQKDQNAQTWAPAVGSVHALPSTTVPANASSAHAAVNLPGQPAAAPQPASPPARTQLP